MGPRNLLILFFSTVAVSLVILIIFFSLFFKNVDLNFNTRLPESAPDIGRQYASGPSMNPESKADGLMRSTVNVPPEMQEPAGGTTNAKKKTDADAAGDNDLPPISDDAALERDNTAPDTEAPLDKPLTKGDSTDVSPSSDKTSASRTGSLPPAPRNPKPAKRQTEPPPSPSPVATPQPAEESAPVSGPPVPGQD